MCGDWSLLESSAGMAADLGAIFWSMVNGQWNESDKGVFKVGFGGSTTGDFGTRSSQHCETGRKNRRAPCKPGLGRMVDALWCCEV